MITLNNSDLLKNRAYINGGWTDGGTGRRYDVLDPASGNKITDVPDMTADDAHCAIAAAEMAMGTWGGMTAKERGKILRNWYELILASHEDLAHLITWECGKPLTESMGEVVYGASFVDWFAEEARRAYGDVIPAPKSNFRILALKQPVGVVAAITPWNFPIAMITRKVAPALAAGCSVVVKPAEDTPLSALALAHLAEVAGMPPGVFNVVTAAHGAEVGQKLCEHPSVRKLSFTGSTRVGKLLMAQCAETVKKVSLELGGNAPFIVFDDADLDKAVAGVMGAKFRNTGQTCVCANRIYVQDAIFDAFAEKLSAATAGLKVGPGFEDGVTQGPLINQAAFEKVQRLVDDATSKGAKLEYSAPIEAKGTFYPPTVLSDVTNDMAISSEEIFGPVAVLYRFTDEQEVVQLANNTRAGLAAYVYAGDMGRLWRVAEKLEYGMVGMNESAISTAEAPFGGVKESGLGREGSKYGIDEFLEIKYLCVGGL